MSLIPEEAAPGAGFYQQCVQELQRPHPDYAKVQALRDRTQSRGK